MYICIYIYIYNITMYILLDAVLQFPLGKKGFMP